MALSFMFLLTCHITENETVLVAKLGPELYKQISGSLKLTGAQKFSHMDQDPSKVPSAEQVYLCPIPHLLASSTAALAKIWSQISF